MAGTSQLELSGIGDRVRDPDACAKAPLRVLVLRSVDGRGGGAEAIILRTASRVDPKRLRMTVCCIHRDGDALYDFDRRAADLGIDYHGVAQGSIFARGVMAGVRDIAARCRAQIVDAQDYKASLFASLLAQSDRILPAATLHGWTGHHWRERFLYYPAERLLVRRFPLVIAVSGQIRDTLVRWGCPRRRIRVLLNGIDPSEFRRQEDVRHRIRASLGISDNDVVLGTVGRIEEQKRFDILLKAAARLLSRRTRLRLAIVGTGSLESALKQQAGRLGISDRCHFLGHRRDMADVYQAFDVLVQSSDYEGTPTVVVEAMAVGLPVVATDVGGTNELLLHEVHGLLVPRRDPEALADAVERTLLMPKETAERVAAACARVADRLSFDERTRRLQQFYSDLVDGVESGRRPYDRARQ